MTSQATWIPQWMQDRIQGPLLSELNYHDPSEYINEVNHPGPKRIARVPKADGSHIPLTITPYKLTRTHEFKFGPSWIQAVINGTVRDEQKLRAHADALGLIHVDLDFRSLLVKLCQHLLEH